MFAVAVEHGECCPASMCHYRDPFCQPLSKWIQCLLGREVNSATFPHGHGQCGESLLKGSNGALANMLASCSVSSVRRRGVQCEV